MHRIFTLLVINIAFCSMLIAQTNGTLSVSVSTSEAGGGYAPRNIVAIWVEDGSGNFVKSLLALANNRKTHLNQWQASTDAAGTEYNTTDAITGATQSSHGTRTCSWNAQDYNSSLVPDGTYTLRMELTDKNGTGNYSSFSFVKGPNVENQTPNEVPSFSSIVMDWQPLDDTGIDLISNKENFIISPNPGTGTYQITGKNIESIEVRNIAGKFILESNNNKIDISNEAKGIYLVKVKTKNSTIIKKLIKN